MMLARKTRTRKAMKTLKGETFLVGFSLKNFFSCSSGSGYGENYDDEDDEYDSEPLGSTLGKPEKEDDNNIYKDMIKTRFVGKQC
jgi:hypothetical protein